MDMPNFHDGHFDGFLIENPKLVYLFLRTHDGTSFTLVLKEVEALRLDDIRQGNLIFDLVLRSGNQLTGSDMSELYGTSVDQQIEGLLAKNRDGGQLLEVNATYGAQGMVLFKTWEISKTAPTVGS